MSKRCELQKEYYQQYGNYKGNGKYCDKYVSWLENEVLALRQPLVMESDCDHEWLNHSFDHFGFLQEQICDKCGTKQSVP